MILTTKSRYAVQAMLYISIKDAKEPTSISEISNSEKISNKYLEQLFRKLRMKKIVKSSRGVYGGYILAKPPSKITVYDIISAVERIDKAVPCKKNPKNKAECVASELWINFNNKMVEYLKSYTLTDLIKKSSKK